MEYFYVLCLYDFFFCIEGTALCRKTSNTTLNLIINHERLPPFICQCLQFSFCLQLKRKLSQIEFCKKKKKWTWTREVKLQPSLLGMKIDVHTVRTGFPLPPCCSAWRVPLLEMCQNHQPGPAESPRLRLHRLTRLTAVRGVPALFSQPLLLARLTKKSQRFFWLPSSFPVGSGPGSEPSLLVHPVWSPVERPSPSLVSWDVFSGTDQDLVQRPQH